MSEPAHLDEADAKLEVKADTPAVQNKVARRCGRPKREKPPELPLGVVYRMDKKQYGTMAFGAIIALLQGAMMPMFSILFGELFNIFFNPGPNAKEELSNFALLFVTLAIGAFIFSYFQVATYVIAAQNYARLLRSLAFRKVLEQDAAYFDKNKTGAITTKLSSDVEKVQKAIEKVPTFIVNLSQALVGIIIAFVYSWKLTLVLLAISPLMAIASAIHMSFIAKGAASKAIAYQDAAIVAQENLSGVRTVQSFVQERTAVNLFYEKLENSARVGRRKAHVEGFGIGFSMFCMFAVYALGFWYGGTLVADGDLPVGDLLVVFFSIVMGAMSFGQLSQSFGDMGAGRNGVFNIVQLLNMPVPMERNLGTGVTKEKLEGNIILKDVQFSYPSRDTIPVLKGISLNVPAGKKVALVGSSGCGKSTVVALIERFYDVSGGSITIDGVEVKDYDLHNLRTKIGLVSQEPILFNTTIKENLLWGNAHATEEQIIAAAKMANAHDFISKFDDKYETKVGEKGTQLSGGQKQRIAIARALLKDPSILLLDEATSALDAESEHVVQEALDRLMEGRTTVIVAHRLSTIRDADIIYVLKAGQVIEQGNHDALMEKKGAYANLVRKQMKKKQLEEVAEKIVQAVKEKKHYSEKDKSSSSSSSDDEADEPAKRDSLSEE